MINIEVTTISVKEIKEQLELAEQSEFVTHWEGETYEAGVVAALKWVLELSELKPMEELP